MPWRCVQPMGWSSAGCRRALRPVQGAWRHLDEPTCPSAAYHFSRAPTAALSTLRQTPRALFDRSVGISESNLGISSQPHEAAHKFQASRGRPHIWPTVPGGTPPRTNEYLLQQVKELAEQVETHVSDLSAGDNPEDQTPRAGTLPLSPLVDPKLVAARARYRGHRKQPATEPDTEFDKALTANPFANLLASPLRMCEVSGLRVPSDLLVSQTIRRDPATQEPRQVPVSFESTDLETAHCKTRVEDILKAKSMATEDDVESLPYYAPTRHQFQRAQRAAGETWTYLGGTHDVLTTRLKRQQLTKFMSFRSVFWTKRFGESFMKRLRVREDMPTFTLNLLQGRLMRLLVILSAHRPSCILPWTSMPSPELDRSSGEQDHIEATPFLLRLGQYPVAPSKGALKDMQLAELHERLDLHGDPSEHRYQYQLLTSASGARILAFDLDRLLNADQMQWLKRHGDIYRYEAVWIKQHFVSTEAFSWLWRLAIFVGNRTVQVEQDP